jgi:toxin-antitoxin system PIN domain toxin
MHCIASWTRIETRAGTATGKGLRVFVADTNVLVYAAIQECPGHERVRARMLEWGNQYEPWFITWSIAYEFLSVATHRSVFAYPLSFSQAWSFLEALTAFPSLEILLETDYHAEVVRELARQYPQISGSRFHDLHIVAVMKEHGISEIRTADTHFHQFKFLRVTNPLV